MGPPRSQIIRWLTPQQRMFGAPAGTTCGMQAGHRSFWMHWAATSAPIHLGGLPQTRGARTRRPLNIVYPAGSFSSPSRSSHCTGTLAAPDGRGAQA